MLAHHAFEFRRQAKLGEPDRGLIGFEHSRGELHIEQPVLGKRWLGAVLIEKKAGLRFLPEHTVFQAELIIGDLDLLHTVECERIKRLAHVPVAVIPEDNALGVEQACKAGVEAVLHQLSPVTFFRALPNLG